MNKFLKLPLFLAVVGGVCTAVLATTYAITNPIVVQREQKEKYSTYFKDFDLLESDGETPKVGAVAEELEVTSDLSAKGITAKVSVSYNGSALGMAYNADVQGYGGSIKFALSFKEGNYNSFTCLSQSETDGFGGVVVLSKLNEYLSGKPATEFTVDSLNTGIVDYVSASTSGTTRKNLIPAIVAMANDYAATL